MNINFNSNNIKMLWLSNIITIILGLVIGLIIGYIQFKKYIYKGPDSNIITQNIYSDENGNKYKWVPNICICPINLSMNKLKDPDWTDPNH